MNEYIEAIKSGNLVEARKKFNVIMEERKEALRQELRVQIAEEVRGEGETDPEDKDVKNKKDKNPEDKDEKSDSEEK